MAAKPRTLRIDSLESRCLLTTTFVPHAVDVSDSKGSLYSADLDGDHDIDLLAVDTSGNDGIHWFENLGGDETQFARGRRLGGLGFAARSIAVADVDGDDDLDIVGVADRYLFLLENVNGRGGYSVPQRIRSLDPTRTPQVKVADVDGDLNLDIVLFTDGTPFWLNNTGKHVWSDPQSMSLVRANDELRHIDGDNIADLVRFDGASTRVYSGNGDGTFSERLSLPGRLETADIDADGDVDLVSLDRIYENDGHGEFQERPISIPPPLLNPHTLRAFQVHDVNGDGLFDIVFHHISRGGDDVNTVSYSLNLGEGKFGDATEVVQSPFWLEWTVADFNQDSLADVVVVRPQESQISMFDAFTREIDITDRGIGFGFGQFKLRDVDADGDLDILAMSMGGVYQFNSESRVTVYENKGNLEFSAPILIGSVTGPTEFLEISHADIGDIDGDGIPDVAWANKGSLYWNRQSSAGELLEATLVHSGGKMDSVDLEDHDGDGDLDIVVATGATTTVFLNDGVGTSFEKQTVDQKVSVPDLSEAFGDLDGDGDIDRVSGPQVTVWENRVVGDVNNDGRFDSSDLVAVFQANEYEDGIWNNSTFNTGDWNGDGEFNSSDLVFAFQAKNYEVAAAVDGDAEHGDANCWSPGFSRFLQL
ncbi:MAG: VCBS repeat-containing protein [Planctomycetales bacterium]|nr:VCBS repeat-containing protein [Planctomycetales bacterium]